MGKGAAKSKVTFTDAEKKALSQSTSGGPTALLATGLSLGIASQSRGLQLPAPVPTFRQIDDDVRQRDAAKRRQRIAQFGRGGTILTQSQGLATVGAASLLGRSS